MVARSGPADSQGHALSDMDERVVLDRARTGDQSAFADLVAPYRNRIWAVCLRTTGNPHDAEDALQETLTAAWQALAKFRGDSKFSTWLYRIASNASLAVVRRRPEVAEDVIDHPDGQPDPGDRLADTEQIQSAMARLPEAFRIALVLRVYGDLAYEEIAAHQEIPVQTVKTRLHRARRLLAEHLSESTI